MQEPINQEQPAPAPARRKPLFAIVVVFVVILVVFAAGAAVQAIFGGSYNQSLDKLKGMVATAAGQFESGDVTEGATLTDEYRFYQQLDAQVDNLSDIFAKLNESYPMYLFRTDAQAVGLTELAGKIDALSPSLESLKACVDEDKAISSELQKLLGGEAAEGLSQLYSGLITRNDKLKGSVSGLSFTGAAEAGRSALAQSIEARGQALDCLREDASINEELALILSDVKTPFATNVEKLNALQTRSDALAAGMKGVDMAAYGPNGGQVAESAASRGDRIKTDIDYLGQLGPLQTSMANFCAGLGKDPTGKLSARLKVYMGWIKQLKTMQSQLDAINKDKKYANADKITIEDLGMTPAGKELLSYEKALTGVNTALASSATIETQINALVKDTKKRMVDKVTTLNGLLQKNSAVMKALSAKLPPALKDLIGKYTDGCKERAVFLDDYANYLIAKDNSNNAYRSYSNGMTGVTYQQYRDALKVANDWKAKYEASRKKYQPMLNV